MIGKITKGNGFAGVCSYILSKDEARLIGGNMASTTPRQLAAEFRVFSQKNQRVQVPVEHISLSPSPGDRELDDRMASDHSRFAGWVGDEPASIYSGAA